MKVLEVFSVLLLVEAKTALKSPNFIENLLGLRRGDLNIALIDLHSILDIPAQVGVGEVRVLHASLGDFLLDQTRSGNYYINQGLAHANLTQCFMKYIPLRDDDDISGLRGLSFANLTVHCSQSYPTAELLDALWSFDVSTFWTLYFPDWNPTFRSELDVNSSRVSLLFDFLDWLKNNGSSKEGQDLYSRYIFTWDRSMQHYLTQLPPLLFNSGFIIFLLLEEFRNNYQVSLLFTQTPLTSTIPSATDFYNADRRYNLLLTEFFHDPSRSGPFYLHGDKYANFALTFTKYLLSLRVWTILEHDLTRLSTVLSKASYSKELATLLNSELPNMIKVRRCDLVQAAADIVKAYCNNFQSSDNCCAAHHIDDSGTLNYNSASRGPDQRAGSWIRDFLGWLSSGIRCL